MVDLFDQAVFLKFLAALLAVFNPLYGIPIFLSMTDGYSSSERLRVAVIVTFSVTIVALITVAVGEEFLAIFGIDVPSFRIAGGAIIFGVGMTMLNAATPVQGDRNAAEDGHKKKNFAVVPLALPLTIGPGAIATTIVFSHQLPDGAELVTLGSAVIIACAMVGVGLIFADAISRTLGKTLMSVLTRIMAIVLVAVSVEMILTGAFDAVDARYPNMLPAPSGR